MRTKVERQMARKQKEEKEERLRGLALHARANRAGIRPAGKFDYLLIDVNDVSF